MLPMTAILLLLATRPLVRMDNHTGKTWAEIVGETSKMRIATDDTTTSEVDVASIAGMTHF